MDTAVNTSQVMQTVVVVAIVAIALAFIARKAWRTIASARRSAKDAGCTTCGCETPRDPLSL